MLSNVVWWVSFRAAERGGYVDVRGPMCIESETIYRYVLVYVCSTIHKHTSPLLGWEIINPFLFHAPNGPWRTSSPRRVGVRVSVSQILVSHTRPQTPFPLHAKLPKTDFITIQKAVIREEDRERPQTSLTHQSPDRVLGMLFTPRQKSPWPEYLLLLRSPSRCRE